MISLHVLGPQMLSAKTFPVKPGQIMREQKHKQGNVQEVETLAERNQRTKCPIVFLILSDSLILFSTDQIRSFIAANFLITHNKHNNYSEISIDYHKLNKN